MDPGVGDMGRSPLMNLTQTDFFEDLEQGHQPVDSECVLAQKDRPARQLFQKPRISLFLQKIGALHGSQDSEASALKLVCKSWVVELF